MRKFIFLIVGVILVIGCVNSSTSKKELLEFEFLKSIGKSSTWSRKVKILALDKSETKGEKLEEELDLIAKGYTDLLEFVSYDYEPLCYDIYSIFEKCTNGTCNYKFIRVESLCE